MKLNQSAGRLISSLGVKPGRRLSFRVRQTGLWWIPGGSKASTTTEAFQTTRVQTPAAFRESWEKQTSPRLAQTRRPLTSARVITGTQSSRRPTAVEHGRIPPYLKASGQEPAGVKGQASGEQPEIKGKEATSKHRSSFAFFCSASGFRNRERVEETKRC